MIQYVSLKQFYGRSFVGFREKARIQAGCGWKLNFELFINYYILMGCAAFLVGLD